MNTLIQVKNLSVHLSGFCLLKEVTFDLEAHDRLMIVGPNGAGKSTLIQAMVQGVPYQGEIILEGTNLASLSSQERARKVGVFAQRNEVHYGFSVKEVVALGRYSYRQGFLSANDEEEQIKVKEALEATGLSGKSEQSVLTLSGGELQRVFLAQLFAQDPQILLLDEPTNHLDILFHKELQELISTWAQKNGRAVIAVVHDLSLARLYGNKTLLLAGGEVKAFGSQKEVFGQGPLNEVYQMDVFRWMETLYAPWSTREGIKAN